MDNIPGLPGVGEATKKFLRGIRFDGKSLKHARTQRQNERKH
jgi:hypothetical protein